LKSALLAGLFAGLLRLLTRLLAGLLLTLLTRVLAGLLTLLVRLIALPALLRLALVVLVHFNSPNKLPKYNLNAHHSNYRCYLWSSRTKTSAAYRYISPCDNPLLAQWLDMARIQARLAWTGQSAAGRVT
jgi:hypothetical protein